MRFTRHAISEMDAKFSELNTTCRGCEQRSFTMKPNVNFLAAEGEQDVVLAAHVLLECELCRTGLMMRALELYDGNRELLIELGAAL